jgi:hypothetical protein
MRNKSTASGEWSGKKESVYRSLLVKYSVLREKEIAAMPMDCWNALVKFADWLDREADQQNSKRVMEQRKRIKRAVDDKRLSDEKR